MIEDVKPDAKPENIDPDWIAHFFDRSRLISDADMQTFWGRLLAGEANKPGAFSKRTLDCVATLSKEEALLFTSLCGFTCMIGIPTLVVFDFTHEIYAAHGLTFNSIAHLEDIGLVKFQATLGGFSRLRLPSRAVFLYFGTPIGVELPHSESDPQTRLPIGRVLLTQTGRELADTCGAKPVEGFVDYLIAEWQKQNIRAERLDLMDEDASAQDDGR